MSHIPLPMHDTLRIHPFFERLVAIENAFGVLFTNEEIWNIYNLRWDYLNGVFGPEGEPQPQP